METQNHHNHTAAHEGKHETHHSFVDRMRAEIKKMSAVRIAWILGGVAVALLIFQVGLSLGYHKAEYSGRLGDGYYRMFQGGPTEHVSTRCMRGAEGTRCSTVTTSGGPGKGAFMGGVDAMRDMMKPQYLEAHGAAGEVLRITLPDMVIEQNDGTEKVVTVGDDTIVRKFRSTIKATDITEGSFVVVVGAPDTTGRIAAKLIRIMPDPETMHLNGMMSTSSNMMYKTGAY